MRINYKVGHQKPKAYVTRPTPRKAQFEKPILSCSHQYDVEMFFTHLNTRPNQNPNKPYKGTNKLKEREAAMRKAEQRAVVSVLSDTTSRLKAIIFLLRVYSNSEFSIIFYMLYIHV